MTTQPSPKKMTVSQATFIGVASMVGAGIFALLGAAGAVAGSAVWLSFLIAGAIAGLQGYSFAKLGSVYPSGGGLLHYLAKGLGDGHVTGITSWLFYVTAAIVTAMVASSFGGYASSVLTDNDPTWTKVFAVAIVLVMAALNVVGSTAVAKVQSLIVKIVLTILTVFVISTLLNFDPALLAPSGYPSFREIIASVALTFFAFLGFGVITFTAKDLPNPSKQLPKAMYLALAIATTVYVGVSLGVFGTLTAEQVVAYGPTALAEAAKPTLGQFGYVLMVITALFSTAGATNSGLYPSTGMTKHLASVGQFPPVLGRTVGSRKAPVGLLLLTCITLTFILLFDLNKIASIGSAVALLVFTMVTLGHFRLRDRTGANVLVLAVALVSTLGTFLVFCGTTLADEPATAVTMVVIVVAATITDLLWKRSRDRKAPPTSVAVDPAGAA